MSRLYHKKNEHTVKLAFWACKGGAGKSFFAYNLASILANDGLKVLYVGFDSQQDASNMLLAATEGFEPDDHRSLREVLEGKCPASEAIYTSREFRKSVFRESEGHMARRASRSRDNMYTFDIIPAGDGLTLLSDLQPEDLYAVGKVMKDVEPMYDFIILDLPPSDAASTELALAYADHVFIPVNDSTWADSIALCSKKLDELNEMEFKVKLSGMIINQFHTGSDLDSYNEGEIRKVWGDKVLDTKVPYSNSARNAFALGLPLVSYPYSAPIVFVLYRLAEEIVRRIEK